MKRILYYFIFVTVFLSCGGSPDGSNSLVHQESKTPKVVTSNLSQDINDLIENIVESHEIPALQISIFKSGKVLHQMSYGDADFSKPRIFDLASLTKPFTASLIMLALEEGLLKLSDTLDFFYPKYFKQKFHKEITIQHLLSHSSGYRSGLKEEERFSSKKKNLKSIGEVNQTYPLGKFKYSDINYILLGFILEDLYGKSLDALLQEKIVEKLQLEHTGFLPLKRFPQCLSLCIPSNHLGPGIVHDPSAYDFGFVAGSAGVFSTLDDLVTFFTTFLKKDTSLLSLSSIDQMLTPDKNGRGFGFDFFSPYSVKPKGESFNPKKSFGHTGYTGTSIWMDPELDVGILVLSNAVHGKSMKKSKRGFFRIISEVATLVGKTLE